MAQVPTNNTDFISEQYDEPIRGNISTTGNETLDYNYYPYDLYDYYDYSEHIYEIFEFESPIYGYLWPIIVLITACCNVLVIAAFLRKRMRSATNMILVSIAVSDSLTGLVTLPATIHVFSMYNFALTKEWCEATMLTRLFVSRAFHTASVWQTLLLGVHRYAQLRDPVKAQRWVNMRKTAIGIALIYVISFVLHIYHVFDIKTDHGMCNWVLEVPCVRTCIYIWCALLFGHLIPCFVLLCLTIGMVKRVRVFDTRCHSEATLQSRKKSEQSRILTMTVVAIVVIFLVPEFPYGIFYLITVSLRHSGRTILPLKINRLIHCLYEVLLVLSFHLNFWVYCLLIRNFRTCIKRVIQLATCRVVRFKRVKEDTTTSSEAVELRAIKSETEYLGNEDL